MAKLTVQLHPIDVVMFRESRWFGTSAGDSESLFPPPRTVAGAMRTYLMDACGIDYRQLRTTLAKVRKETRGPEYMVMLKEHLKGLCCASWAVDAQIIGPFLGNDGIRYYPLPKTFVRDSTGSDAVSSLRPAAAFPSSSPRWALAPDPHLQWETLPDGWISRGNLEAYLRDGKTMPKWPLLERHTRSEIILDEPRVGVSIDPSVSTAANSFLYTSTFSRLREHWYLEADVIVDETGAEALQQFAVKRPWLRLGGDAKVARVEIAQPNQAPPQPPAGRSLLYLATPGLFAGGGHVPAKFPHPLAAVTDRPLPVSGWDLATNRPMWSRYAVPAGAVYFYDDGAAIPHDDCISDDPLDCESGWGYCLRGAW